MPNTPSESVVNPFPALFVDTEWLASRLPSPEFSILQVGGERYYPQFHIPGAVLLSYSDLVTIREGVPGMRADVAVLADRFGRAGITLERPVLVYDTGGGMDAARAVWTLSYLGHTAVAILDGGFGLWYRENRTMSYEPPPVQAQTFLPRPDPEWEATAAQVLAVARSEGGARLLDTRTPNEYLGLTQREPRGHIAGARLFNWADALRESNDPRLKERDVLMALLAAAGCADPHQEVILYCETAHRASHTWLLLRHLGFTRVRLYDGSMAEWRLLGYPLVAGGEPR
ncbi:MAG: sulfurtransferase [Magnetococcus sp. YQC-3]